MKKVCKTKDDFIFELHSELHRLGVDGDNDIYNDFEEHFKASMLEGLSEEEICEKLGDVSEIARDYVDETEINAMVDKALDKAGSKSVLMSSLPLNPSQRRGISLKKPRDRHEDELTAEPEGEHESVWKNSEELTSKPQRRGISLTKPSQPAKTEQAPMEDDILPDGTRISAANNYATPNSAKQTAASAAPEQDAMPKPTQSAQTAPNGKRNIPTPDTANVNIPPLQKTASTTNTNPSMNAGAVPPPPPAANTTGTYNGGPILPQEPPHNCGCSRTNGGVNVGGLIGALCIDIFVLSWAIPSLFGVIMSYFSIPAAVFGWGIANIIGFASGGAYGFHPISNILLGLAMLCLTGLAVLLGIIIVKGFIKLIIKIVKWHVRLIKGENK